MKKFRCIYMIEGITEAGNLVYRLFAANKRVAEKLARQHAAPAYIRKLHKYEHDQVNPADVQR